MLNITLITFALLFQGFTQLAGQEKSPATGEMAPDFSLPYATKDSISRIPLILSDYRGKANVLLAFYPADWSSGCTKEVCTLRDEFAGLQTLQVEILGISGDYIFSHHEWAKHHNLPFKLLSDHFHTAAKSYGSYNEKSGMNRRTVFLIDKLGTIIYQDNEYSVRDDTDFQRLIKAVQSLH